MAIISKITVGGKLVLEVNADPSVNATPAPIGSKALFNDAGVGKEYLKVSASDTSWQMVVSGAIDLSPYLKKDGSVAITGDMLPAVQNGVNFGSDALHYNSFYMRSLEVYSAGIQRGFLRHNGSALLLNSVSGNLKLQASTSIIDVTASRLTNAVDPVSAQDVATKKYTDDADALLIPLAQKGAVSGVAPLGADQKIPNIYLPALAITDTFVVASQVAMLALGGSGAEKGDVAVRTDLNKSFILAGADPSVLADWQELLTPTDTVLSVNGQIGAVVLTTTDIAEGTNLYFTAPRAVSAALASEKLWIAGDLASELNVATGIKYFGTKSGDFDIVFMRNNVERMRLDGTDLIMPSNGGLKSNGNLNIISSTGNIAVTALGGNLTLNGVSINSSVRTRFQNHLELTTGDLLIRSYEQTKKLAVVDADATKTLVYGENLTSKNKSIEMKIYFKADSGVHAFYKKTAHIDSTGALVISQDDMTSKSVAAASLDVQVSYAGGNLTLSFSGMAGMTNKNCVVQYREEGAF